jgi:hypothetical protein
MGWILMSWGWKPRTPQRLTIEMTDRVGEVTKTYRLDIPANTTFDDIEALLMIVGAIPPHVTGVVEPISESIPKRRT